MKRGLIAALTTGNSRPRSREGECLDQFKLGGAAKSAAKAKKPVAAKKNKDNREESCEEDSVLPKRPRPSPRSQLQASVPLIPKKP